MDYGFRNLKSRDKNKSLLENYKSYNGNLTVKITNDSFSKVEGVGSAYLIDKVMLKTTLYVPNLAFYLLLASKLLKDFNFIAKFTLVWIWDFELKEDDW